MDYISVKEAAEKWNISQRYVQRRCLEGRIEGAVKFGKSWMIPCETKKPDNAEGNNKEHTVSYEIMPLMNSRFPKGKCKEYIESIKDKDLKNIATAEYYYYTGNIQECAEIAAKYLDSKVFELRISALWLFAFSSLCLEKLGNVRKALKEIRILYEKTANSSNSYERAVAVCLYNSVYCQFRVLKPKDIISTQDYVHALPQGLRLYVLFQQAHYAFIHNMYGVAVGIAETGLVLDDIKYPIATIYLHIACAMSYMHIGYAELSKEHIMAAREIALADDFIQPFGEFHGPLCGMLEFLFKKSEPQQYRKIIKATRRYSAGWIKIHNEVTGDNIPTDLTPTEYVVSMLVARGWHSKEVAHHLGITDNAVHKAVSEAMSKMGVTKRAQIKEIMLHK